MRVHKKPPRVFKKKLFDCNFVAKSEIINITPPPIDAVIASGICPLNRRVKKNAPYQYSIQFINLLYLLLTFFTSSTAFSSSTKSY